MEEEKKTALEKFEIRKGDLALRKAVYLGKEPDIPSYHIDKIQPNTYYGHEDDYEWSKDGSCAYAKIDGETNYSHRIDKSCFQSKETSYAIASFEYNEREDFYEFKFCGDRPTALDEEEIDIFWELIKIGFFVLNYRSKTVY